MSIIRNEKGQAMPAKTIPIGNLAFAPLDCTKVYWLGNASILINSRGTTLMIDPLLKGFDMPLLIDMPILPNEVPALDGVLITHIDNDHFSRPTLADMKDVCKSWHAPHYVAEQMEKELSIDGAGHGIGDTFSVGSVQATLTPAKHNWQNDSAKYNYRVWKEEEYCGYWLDTPDGTVWLPGDSRLLDAHLHMPEPDIILLDFADNSWHITLDGAVRLANAYPKARLLCIHWGSVDASEMNTFNGDPEVLAKRIENPERVCALMPGEALTLKG